MTAVVLLLCLIVAPLVPWRRARRRRGREKQAQSEPEKQEGDLGSPHDYPLCALLRAT
jgi:hypothetical protein